MGDGAADLTLRPLDIDMDPLAVVGGLGEAVDAALVQIQPVRGAQVLPGQAGQVGEGDDARAAHALLAILFGPAKPNIQAAILRIWISSAPSVMR
ncbi:hypothetical protein D3C73_571070 [compost metagenome]